MKSSQRNNFIHSGVAKVLPEKVSSGCESVWSRERWREEQQGGIWSQRHPNFDEVTAQQQQWRRRRHGGLALTWMSISSMCRSEKSRHNQLFDSTFQSCVRKFETADEWREAAGSEFQSGEKVYPQSFCRTTTQGRTLTVRTRDLKMFIQRGTLRDKNFAKVPSQKPKHILKYPAVWVTTLICWFKIINCT